MKHTTSGNQTALAPVDPAIASKEYRTLVADGTVTMRANGREKAL